VPGAIVFRVSNLVEDVDGSMRACHPPTETSWNGYGPHQGLGKDSLANAVSVPAVTDYAHSKNEQDWSLTAGCQLFRDLNTARGLEPKAAPAQPVSGHPAPGKPAYEMVADSGPWGHLCEVSRKMIDDLGFPGDSPSSDYIVVIFPEALSDTDIAKEKQVATIRSDAQAAFEAWTWEGRSGIDLVKELFPTADQYHRVQKEFANAKQYLTTYVDQMVLKLT
jgi:hypothetical protein